jgi:DNA repair protein RadD
MIQLRDYQNEAITATWGGFRHGDNVLLSLPTGAGKTIIFSALSRQAVEQYQARTLIVANRLTLVQQSVEKMHKVWPGAPIEIYSAGMNRKRFDWVTAGTINTLVKAENIPPVSLLIIDECHDIAEEEGHYNALIERLFAENPDLRVLGCTATPFRTNGGLIYGPDKLFKGVTYSLEMQRLIDAGHLCRVKSATVPKYDLSEVRIDAGKFVEIDLFNAVAGEDLIRSTAKTTVETLQALGCNHWLVFCVNIAHSEAMASALNELGVSACSVTTNQTHKECRGLISAFKAGRFTALCSVGKLQVGFDAEIADAGVDLAPTESPGAYVQRVGRVMRTHPGKEFAYWLDFAGNVNRHGPVDGVLDAVKARTKRLTPTEAKEVRAKEPPVCGGCGAVMTVSLHRCYDCGWEKPALSASTVYDSCTSEKALLKTDAVEGLWKSVHSSHYHSSVSRNDEPMLVVTLVCGLLDRHVDYLLLETKNVFALQIARRKWHYLYGGKKPYPTTVQEALDRARAGELQCPTKIRVRQKQDFWEITNVQFGNEHSDDPARAVVGE